MMMQKTYRIWMLLLGMVASVSVFGQTGVDTLGLTGTMADTVVARRLINEAIKLIKQSKYDEAFMKADSARMIFKEVLGEETKEVADALHQMGMVRYYQGNHNKAIEYNQKALEINLKTLGAEHPKTAFSYNNLGNSYHSKGEYDKAIDYKKKSLEIKLKTLGADHPNVASTYNSIGISYESKGEYDNAIEYEKKGLEIRLKTLGANHPDVASSYNSIGISYGSKGEYDNAIEYKKKGLEIRLKTLGAEHPDVASSYNSIGTSYKSKGEYEKSIEYCQKGLKIRLKTLRPEHPDIASSYNNIGLSYEKKGEYKKAIENNEKGLEIRLKTLGADHPDVASSYNNIGISYNSEGEYDKAVEYYQKALEIRLKTLGANNSNVAGSYNNLGISYYLKGDYDKSIEYNQKGLKIRLKALGAEHPYVADSYNNFGNSYNSKGEYDKAIEYEKKSLLIQLKALGAEHPYVADSYNGLGNSYNSKGEYDNAIEYYQTSLKIKLKTLGAEHPFVATSYNNLGNACYSKGEYDKAIEYEKKGLEIRLKTLGEEHPAVASSHNNLGNAYYSKGEYDKSIEYYQKGLEIRLKTLGAEHPAVASSYNKLGSSYNSKGEYDKAIECYRQAITACSYTRGDFSKVNSFKELLYGFNKLSLIFKKQYLQIQEPNILTISHDYALEAFEVIDCQQTDFTEESSKSFWLSQNYPIYEQAISVSLLKAQIDHKDTLRQNSFTYSEKSKASLLQSQIKETSAFSGLPDSLLQQEHDLRIDITWREKQRQALLDKGVAETDTNTLRISSIIFDLRRQYEDLKHTFETQYPDYYRLKYDLSTVSLNYVRDTLLQPGQTLLEYFTGDSAIYIFAVRPDTFHIVEVKKDFPLEDWVKHLRHGLTDYYVKNSKSAVYLDSTAREYVAAASDLYQKLIAPVAGLLDSTVIIVPDGVLGYVPFDVLLSEKPAVATRFHSHAYLGKEKRISYAYSATLLRDMRDKKHKTPPTENLLALAPFFRGDVKQLHEQVDTLSEILALRRDTLGALPASGREALVVAKIYYGKALLGDASPKEVLQQEAGRYRILHLSTHGKADDKVGDYAYLGFAMPGDALAFDKFYAKDIYNLALNADLVTLSACETGIGELKRGEGIISLARAFAYAGAKSIVTTLWSVNDARTGELMEGFYKNLYHGMDKDTALWKAKKDFIAAHKKDAAHPYFWAGFIPIGDMRAVEKN